MSDHEEDMRMSRENPKGFLEVHSDEELNSSFTLLGWQYLQIVDRARREIRARRDEIFRNNTYEDNARREFTALFDDGAEFGPDKPEPEIKVVVDCIDGLHWVDIFLGEKRLGSMSRETFDAIKKLGAEEARGE